MTSVRSAKSKELVACKWCKNGFIPKFRKHILCSEYCRKENAKERSRKYREDYPDEVARAKALCYEKRRDYYNEKSKLYILENKEKVKERQQAYYDRQNPYRLVLQEAEIEEKCVLCEVTKSGNNRLSVHHIDGNHTNNDLLNLVWICESCHQYVHNSEGIHSELINIKELIR